MNGSSTSSGTIDIAAHFSSTLSMWLRRAAASLFEFLRNVWIADKLCVDAVIVVELFFLELIVGHVAKGAKNIHGNCLAPRALLDLKEDEILLLLGEAGSLDAIVMVVAALVFATDHYFSFGCGSRGRQSMRKTLRNKYLKYCRQQVLAS